MRKWYAYPLCFLLNLSLLLIYFSLTKRYSSSHWSYIYCIHTLNGVNRIKKRYKTKMMAYEEKIKLHDNSEGYNGDKTSKVNGQKIELK